MIKFFRKIRHSLINQNKMGKYFKYAIGEIVLVVIGILIALQINNWNESRKINLEEKQTISILKLEFEKNLKDLESNIQTVEAIKNACDELLKYAGPNHETGTLKKADSLISMTVRMSIWDPSLYTLSDIKNSGKLSKLSNHDLKMLLIEWESFYTNLLDWGDFYVSRGNKYFDFLLDNSINRNFSFQRQSSGQKSKFQGSNEDLLRNINFENYLTNKSDLNAFMLNYYREAKELLIAIIKQCDNI